MEWCDLQGFYSGKRVLVTGSTGFKGSWLCSALLMLGANVYGYALEPPTEPSAWNLLRLEDEVSNTIADVRDIDALYRAWESANPDVVFHLAAQPIVRESYARPRETYETNVMGTINLLECARRHPVASLLNVTTDKVYENKEDGHAFAEDEKLDGWDPYSNSKSCSELVTHSYQRSFPSSFPAVSTARAGNVIGGGDYSVDRIVPDCVRAACGTGSIYVRNPHSIRPYQHVLEPIGAYLMLAAAQGDDPSVAGWYNVGPDDTDCITTGRLATTFCDAWGEGVTWFSDADRNAAEPHEAGLLRLDSSRLRETFGWHPTWGIDRGLRETVLWYKAWQAGEDMREATRRQIDRFFLSL